MKKKMIFMVMLLSLIAVWSCDSAKEKVEEVADKAGEMANDAADKTTELADEVAKKAGEAADKVENIVEDNFMIGTWSGKFDGRKTVLVITKQDGNNVEGKITINYRDVINQELKGSLDTETNTLIMEDQLHSRFAGKYNGKLSEDNSVYSGQFTMKLNGTKFNFNLKKN
jgi:PBP1b-binding outer membrane lipoprotein LpoB